MSDAGQWSVLRRRWRSVRGAIGLASLSVLLVGLVLNPLIAARLLSSDGELSPLSSRRLTLAHVATLTLAGLLATLAWRWRQHTPTRERLVIGVMFSTAGLVGALLIGEGALWAASGILPLRADRHFFFLHDPLLGWRHRPNAVALFKGAVVRINSAGLRDEEVPLRRRPGESRLMFLGDSQVFGDGVSADQTFVQQLEELMPVQAINAAVIGYGTDQQLLYFEQSGRHYELDGVVLGLNAFDLTDNISTRVRSGYVKPKYELVDGALELRNVPISEGSLVDRVQRYLTTRSHLYTLLEGILQRPGSRTAGEGDRASDLMAQVFPSGRKLDEALEVTSALVNALAARAKDLGIPLVVALLPYEMDFKGDAPYRHHMDRLANVMSHHSRVTGFYFIDLRSSLVPDRDLYLDAVHFNAEGHRRAAATLHGFFNEHRLVTSPDAN